jgi:hypothetical protein
MWLTLDAQDVVPTLVGPGGEIGEDTVPEGKVAVVIGSNGDNVAIIGTPQQLRDRVIDGLTLPVPAGVPLVDEL